MKETNLYNENANYIKDKVSAVVPVYNGELFLPHILDSILAQTYPQIEMILVDDGSSDRTLQIAEAYREAFAVRGYEYHIVCAGHRNASAAINHGLSYVTGEFLIWPDSDDRLEKDSVEKRAAFLRSHPQYQAVRSLSYYFDPETEEMLPEDEKTGDLTREYLFWDILEFRTYVCCGCYMLRTKKFFDIYPERHIPEYDVGQNFQMLLPFMYHHRCPTIPEKLYGVCVREGSHSRTKLTRRQEYKKFHDYEDLVDEIAVICHIHDKPSKKRILSWKLKRRSYLAVKYGQRKQLLKISWQMLKCDQRSFYHSVKDFIWNIFCDTWLLRKYMKYNEYIRNLLRLN